jgi:hypothetical protein
MTNLNLHMLNVKPSLSVIAIVIIIVIHDIGKVM